MALENKGQGKQFAVRGHVLNKGKGSGSTPCAGSEVSVFSCFRSSGPRPASAFVFDTSPARDIDSRSALSVSVAPASVVSSPPSGPSEAVDHSGDCGCLVGLPQNGFVACVALPRRCRRTP